jgi:hypothetical protein
MGLVKWVKKKLEHREDKKKMLSMLADLKRGKRKKGHWR